MKENPFRTQPDEYILTILKQAYNFSDYHIQHASEEALDRKLLTEQELAVLIETGIKKREEKRQQNHENLVQSMMHEPDLQSNGGFNRYSFLLPLLILIISGVIFIFTGWILIWLFAVPGAALSTRRSGFFRKKF